MTVFDLTGRKALVTGGAQGLGAGMASALARAGASVAIGDIQLDAGKATAESVNGVFVPLDVTDDESWASAVSGVVSALGGLDIVVNNAGIEISGLIADLDAADVSRMLEVNVLGTALGIKHAFRATRSGPCGRVARPATAAPW